MQRTRARLMRNLCSYDSSVLSRLVKTRPGETKVGQAVRVLPSSVSKEGGGGAGSEAAAEFSRHLEAVVREGARFAIIGVPEDIGPRANLGRGGAKEAYSTFLKHFLNLQSNQYIKSEEILLVGHVECSDLQARSEDGEATLNELRGLCSELDGRVASILQPVFAAGLCPIVIGGGHNNCYPLLQSLAKSLSASELKTGGAGAGGVNAINLDPHADFRALEGRHSGNGFSYAQQEGFLQHYHVLGLHELKNNRAILESLAAANCTYDTYQSLFHRRDVSFHTALATALVTVGQRDFGVELDLDSITGMPVSAYNECGLGVHMAAQYVHEAGTHPRSRYLHLCEAAPQHHPAGRQAGEEAAGQILASLTATFIQAKQQL